MFGSGLFKFKCANLINYSCPRASSVSFHRPRGPVWHLVIVVSSPPPKPFCGRREVYRCHIRFITAFFCFGFDFFRLFLLLPLDKPTTATGHGQSRGRHSPTKRARAGRRYSICGKCKLDLGHLVARRSGGQSETGTTTGYPGISA